MSEALVLASKLKSEGHKMSQFMAGLTDHERGTEVYTEGATWTVREVLAHLMSAERAFLKLFAQVRDGGPGVAEDFEIDRYNASQQKKSQGLSWQDLLQTYTETREEMIRLVSGFSDEDLAKRGRHPFLGATTLREMIKMVYIHNQTHYRDIRRRLGPE
jgi:hypothetical protein